MTTCQPDRAKGVHRFGQTLFCVFLQVCFWTRLIFKSIDWVKQIALPNGWASLNQLKVWIEEKDGSSLSKRGSPTDASGLYLLRWPFPGSLANQPPWRLEVLTSIIMWADSLHILFTGAVSLEEPVLSLPCLQFPLSETAQDVSVQRWVCHEESSISLRTSWERHKAGPRHPAGQDPHTGCPHTWPNNKDIGPLRSHFPLSISGSRS